MCIARLLLLWLVVLLVAGVAMAEAESHPPIPVHFTLDAPGYVTLVIEDATGRRVRNLVSATYYPAGDNTAWWDGLDENGRINETPVGNYQVQGRPIVPGEYRVRGLVRNAVEARYAMTAYHNGIPPWHTADGRGGWLSERTPPSAVLYLPGAQPQMLIGSQYAEVGDGLVWTDLQGRRVRGERSSGAGGGWCGATQLARDDGPRAVPGVTAYTGVVWDGNAEFYALGKSYRLLKYNGSDNAPGVLSGLAAYNGLLVAAFTNTNRLLFYDAITERPLGIAELPDPRGVAFDAKGRLLALSGTALLRFSALTLPALGVELPTDVVLPEQKLPVITLPAPETLVAGLEDPRQLTLDARGNIYVSDWGHSHQVKLYSASGALLRTIGAAGGPKVGPYDPGHMNFPTGLSVAADGRLWVAEQFDFPRRVSVWGADGKLVSAYYGPCGPGGGGNLDPVNSTRCYLHGEGGGMEVALNWAKGESRPLNIYLLPGDDITRLPDVPQYPIVLKNRRYLTNVFTANPAGGEAVASIWQLRNGVAAPVAALGDAAGWRLLADKAFAARWPKNSAKSQVLFAWSDLNDDGQVQPTEVTMRARAAGSITLGADLSALTALSERFTPQGYTAKGAPIYDLNKPVKLVAGLRNPVGQALAAQNGWTVLAPSPASGVLQGAKDGALRWSYPCESPGLAAAALAPLPADPGYIIGITRLLGGTLIPRGTTEELWAVNGARGVVYLFTTDGLFVTTLFNDARQAKGWPDTGERAAVVNDASLGEGCYYPSLTQTADGSIYLVAGNAFAGIFRVDGLESIHRLPEQPLTVQAEELEACARYFHQQAPAPKTLKVRLLTRAMTVDGRSGDWSDAEWAKLDEHTRAAVAISGDRLYAFFYTGDAKLLAAAKDWQQLFTGGALDLQLAADPTADPTRTTPAAGDVRLLVTLSQGNPQATLYRPLAPGSANPVTIRSWHATTFDKIEDVTPDLQLTATPTGEYELSIPLATLGLQPHPGQTLHADLGILRTDGAHLSQRLYWNNTARGLIGDVATEAALTPDLWGRWEIVGE